MLDKKIKSVLNHSFKNNFDHIHQQIDYEQYTKNQPVKKRIWLKSSFIAVATCSFIAMILLAIFIFKLQLPADHSVEAWDQSLGEGNISVGYKETSQYAYSYGCFQLEMQEYMKEINVIRSKAEMDIFRNLVERSSYEGNMGMRDILKEEKFSKEEYYQTKSIILCPIYCSSSVRDIRFTGLVKDSKGDIEVKISWFHPLMTDCDILFKIIFVEVNQNVVININQFDYLIFNTLDQSTTQTHSLYV